jgi:hypothetical protein
MELEVIYQRLSNRSGAGADFARVVWSLERPLESEPQETKIFIIRLTDTVATLQQA